MNHTLSGYMPDWHFHSEMHIKMDKCTLKYRADSPYTKYMYINSIDVLGPFKHESNIQCTLRKLLVKWKRFLRNLHLIAQCRFLTSWKGFGSCPACMTVLKDITCVHIYNRLTFLPTLCVQIYLATMPFKRVQGEETAGGPHALRALWLVQMASIWQAACAYSWSGRFDLRTVDPARRGRLLSVWKKYIYWQSS